MALAQAVAATYIPTPRVTLYKTFGTAQFRVSDFEVEFVGARKESYKPESRNPEVAPGTLDDDQKRRDFTINTLAISLNEGDYGSLIDPFGGLAHLDQRLIKTPLNPDLTFSDDPLRMLRGIRFAAQLDFELHYETLDAIKKNASRISIIIQERITTELIKIIKTPRPSKGFDLLFRTGLLPYFFPQMAALAGAEYIDGKGHKDNFYHTLQVIDNVAARSDNEWLRWAALLHDIGKPATKRFEPGTGWTFHGHEVLGERMTPKIFKQLKLPLHEELRYTAKLVGMHMRPISLTKDEVTDSAMRRLLVDAGPELEDLMVLCESDITSRNPAKVKRHLENFEHVKARLSEVEAKDQMRAWQPPIDGDIIMKAFDLSPSRPVGIIKTRVREAILDGEIPNDYEAAWTLMVEIGRSMGYEVKTKE
jgi:putative nucleotidyltransferase with HDIG domain